MAEKRVSVRLAAVGGRQVRAELEGVGEAGSRGFGRLSREMEAANARLAAQDFEFMNKTRGSVAVALTAADDRVAIDALFCEGPRGILQARASLPVALDVTRWIEAEGDVDPYSS